MGPHATCFGITMGSLDRYKGNVCTVIHTRQGSGSFVRPTQPEPQQKPSRSEEPHHKRAFFGFYTGIQNVGFPLEAVLKFRILLSFREALHMRILVIRAFKR